MKEENAEPRDTIARVIMQEIERQYPDVSTWPIEYRDVAQAVLNCLSVQVKFRIVASGVPLKIKDSVSIKVVESEGW